MTTQMTATSREEWLDHVAEFNRIIRQWKVPLTVSSSGTPEVLLADDNRVPGAALLMAHGYDNRHGGGLKCVHSLSVRSRCFIPPEDKWICRDITEAMLNEGYAVNAQTGQKITHLFHRGKHYISFGIRATDEEAMVMLLRDFSDYRLMRIEEGIYLGLDIHPINIAQFATQPLK